MNNVFSFKDYDAGEQYANAIKANGDKILSIFEEINGIMNRLYGTNWESSGAANAQARYQEIRKNYDVFYQEICAMQKGVLVSVAQYRAADAAASQNISTPSA